MNEEIILWAISPSPDTNSGPKSGNLEAIFGRRENTSYKASKNKRIINLSKTEKTSRYVTSSAGENDAKHYVNPNVTNQPEGQR